MSKARQMIHVDIPLRDRIRDYKFRRGLSNYNEVITKAMDLLEQEEQTKKEN